jgi:hypothetical protein
MNIFLHLQYAFNTFSPDATINENSYIDEDMKVLCARGRNFILNSSLFPLFNRSRFGCTGTCTSGAYGCRGSHRQALKIPSC